MHSLTCNTIRVSLSVSKLYGNRTYDARIWNDVLNESHTEELRLFRTEAVVARQDSDFGRAITLRSLPVFAVLTFGIFAAVLVISFLIFGEYTRRVKLSGTVVPSNGIMRVFARSEGQLAAMDVVEGTRVKSGQHIYTIVSDTITDLGETQAVIAAHLHKQRTELETEISSQQALNEINRAGLVEKERNTLREIEQVRVQIKTASDYADVLKTISENYKGYADKHIITQRESYDRLDRSMGQESELENLRRQATQLEQKLADARSELEGLDPQSKNTISQLQRQMSVIDKEIAEGEARRQNQVISPVSGTVTAVLVKPGETVAAGTPVLSILPDKSELEVHLFGGSDAVGFLKEKAAVQMRYAAFPYQKFGLYRGQVTNISRVTIPKKDLDFIGTDVQPPKDHAVNGVAAPYLVTVKPDNDYVEAYGKHEPIRPGMSVEADVLLDTRRIYEWMLEPLFSLKNTLSDKEMPK